MLQLQCVLRNAGAVLMHSCHSRRVTVMKLQCFALGVWVCCS